MAEKSVQGIEFANKWLGNAQTAMQLTQEARDRLDELRSGDQSQFMDAAGAILTELGSKIPIPGISDMLQKYGEAIQAAKDLVAQIRDNQQQADQLLENWNDPGFDPSDMEPGMMLGPDWSLSQLRQRGLDDMAERLAQQYDKACKGQGY